MDAWAICDTNGGRNPPRILLRHIYATKEGAREAVQYRGYDPQWYPVLQVEVRLKEANHDSLPIGARVGGNSADLK